MQKNKMQQNRVDVWGFYLKIFNFTWCLTKKNKTCKDSIIQVQKERKKAISFSECVIIKVKCII